MSHPKDKNLQDFAKISGDFLKKTMVSGMDVFKDVKENFPKEASQILNKGKEELLKGLSQETTKTIINFTIEKLFKAASDYKLEFSIRIRKNDDAALSSKNTSATRKRRK
ncbi:MAG: hypothetical protein V4591_07520 [Bdellovibrionota bacterium]